MEVFNYSGQQYRVWVILEQESDRNEGKGLQNGDWTSNIVWFRDTSTKEKTEGRAGGGKDVWVLFMSNRDG